MKSLYILIGSLTLVLGIVGIVMPGLPTTVFLLISAWAYARGSGRLHHWLISHRVLGPYINEYLEHRGLTLATKVISISMMTVMVASSVIFFIDKDWVRGLVILAGLVGLVVILRLPTAHIDRGRK